MGKTISPEDKKRLANVLTLYGLSSPDFSGKVTINISQGGINDIERYEKIK